MSHSDFFTNVNEVLLSTMSKEQAKIILEIGILLLSVNT